MPLEVDGEAVFELAPLPLDDAVELFTRRAAAAGRRDEVHELCRALDGLPLAIELAAARTRTLPVEEIARRLDDRFGVLSDPASRKPERRRALRATIGWSYELLFPDDKRGLWALATFTGGAPLAAVESVLGALDVPPSAAIDVVGRLASRSLVIVDDPPRYRLLDSIRAFALEAMGELGERAFDAHAAWYAAPAAVSTAGVRSARQAEHLAFARAERANIDAALAGARAHDPLRALAIVNGFGWAWIVLGDAAGRSASSPRSTRRRRAPRASARPRCCSRPGSRRPPATSSPPGAHVAEATALAGDAATSRRAARTTSPTSSPTTATGRKRSRSPPARASSTTGSTDPWDQAANALFAARAAISAGDRVRAAAARDEVQRWLRRRRRPVAARPPRRHARRARAASSAASTTPSSHIGRAAETSGRLGFLQTEAYQLTSLGRAQCQAGDYEAGAATLALGDRQGGGDRGRAARRARARAPRPRAARARPDAEARAALEAAAAFHRAAGGGEQAALGDWLLAALDGATASGSPRCSLASAGDAPGGGASRSTRSRADGHDDIDEADRRMADASHFITERDRTRRSPRWCSTTNAEQPAHDDRDARRLTGVDRPRRAAGRTTRPRAPAAPTWAIPIVPIWIVFCA